MRFDADMGDFPSLTELTGRTPERELFTERLDLLVRLPRRPRHLRLHRLRARPPDPRSTCTTGPRSTACTCSVRAPFHVAAEVWGGLNVDGAGILDSPDLPRRRRGARRQRARLARRAPGRAAAADLRRRRAHLRPALGLQARVSYERTMSPTGEPRAPGEPAWGVVDEHVGLTTRGNLLGTASSSPGSPSATTSSPAASTRSTPARAPSSAATASRPSTCCPRPPSTATRSGTSSPRRRSTTSASPTTCRSGACAPTRRPSRASSSTTTAPTPRPAASLGGRMALGRRGWVRLDGYYENGYGGLRAGVDLAGRVKLWGDDLGIRAGSVFAEGRLSYVSFRDDSRPEDHADSFGVQAGMRWTPLDGISRARPRRGERQPHLHLAAARAGAARSVVLGRHEAARHPSAAAVERPVIARCSSSRSAFAAAVGGDLPEAGAAGQLQPRQAPGEENRVRLLPRARRPRRRTVGRQPHPARATSARPAIRRIVATRRSPRWPSSTHVVMPAPNLKFDHAVHVGKGVACTRCHDALDRIDVATRNQLPTMGLCLECHDSRRAPLHGPSRCATCHLTRPDNTVETEYPTGMLIPSGVLRGDAHTLDFRTHHSSVAANDEKYCANCHRQDFCLVLPQRRGQAARLPRQRLRLAPSHRRAQGLAALRRLPSPPVVLPRLPRADGRRRHPHRRRRRVRAHRLQALPPARLERSGRRRRRRTTTSGRRSATSSSASAATARRPACSATRPTASAAGGAGKMWVNPHPPDWAGSLRCQSLADRNLRVCLRCHAAGDPELSCR